MSDFFENLEAQQRRDNIKCLVGAAIGVLLAGLAVEIIDGSPGFLSYWPTIFDAIPGALVASSIVDFQEKRSRKT